MANKLPMLEEFEQTKKDPCQCGGNCGCGGNKSVNEAKKYKFKDLAKAWEFVYGEDMEDEYQGFYQEVTGKYKNKVTKADIAEIWNKVYGEDIEAEYDGFYNELKENLNEANKLEEFNNLNEKEIKGKDAGNDVKMAPAGRTIEINDVIYTCLGKGKWEGPDGEKLNWIEISAMASALGNKKVVYEANADGTISDDEDERMDIAEQEFYDKALALAQELKEEAYEIGGDFRGPGYEHKLMLQVKDAFKQAKLKLR